MRYNCTTFMPDVYFLSPSNALFAHFFVMALYLNHMDVVFLSLDPVNLDVHYKVSRFPLLISLYLINNSF